MSALGATASVVLGALLVVAPAAAAREGEDLEALIARLEAPAAAERDAALVALEPRLLDPDVMRAVLLAARRSPEIDSRLRAALRAAPALAAPLVALATTMDGDHAANPELVADVTGHLVDLLATEIARRSPRERWFGERAARAPAATATIVGAAHPFTTGLPLAAAIAELSARGGFLRPIALDPSCEAAGTFVLAAVELAPSTAGGLLTRWLALAELESIDLGICQLATTREVADAFPAESEFEARSDPARCFELEAARLLASRLLDSRAESAARFQLWRALAIPGAPEAAARLVAPRDKALSLLAATARGASESLVLGALDVGAECDSGASAVLRALRHGPRLPPEVGAALRAGTEAGYLAHLDLVTQRRIDAPAGWAGPFAIDERATTSRSRLALAAARLAAGEASSEEFARWLGSVLDDAGGDPDLRLALARRARASGISLPTGTSPTVAEPVSFEPSPLPSESEVRAAIAAGDAERLATACSAAAFAIAGGDDAPATLLWSELRRARGAVPRRSRIAYEEISAVLAAGNRGAIALFDAIDVR
jgi:hypothetical protein